MNRSASPAHALIGPAVLLVVSTSACLRPPPPNRRTIVLGVPSSPVNLDPRIGTDDSSQKIGQLIFSSLMTLDDHLRVVPQLADRVDNPDPRTYVVALRRGVMFHDGHELTSADVVYTFRSMLAPGFVSPIAGAFGTLERVAARDRYTVVFTLT